MNQLKLYHADYSTCSQKVRIALAEKELPFVSVPMSFRKEEQLTPEYLAINPNGVVPTLTDNDVPIVDSSCILEYLDEVFPEKQLSPTSPLERAKMRAWLRYIEEVPTTAIRIPSFEDVFLPTLRIIQTAKSFDRATDKRTLRKGFYAKMNRGKGFSDMEFNNSMHQLRDTVVRMDSALRKSKWILNEHFSLVDVTLAPLIDRAEDLGMNFIWKDLLWVVDWLARVQDRLSFKTAFYKGSRLSQRFEFKLAMHSARKQNASRKLENFL